MPPSARENAAKPGVDPEPSSKDPIDRRRSYVERIGGYRSFWAVGLAALVLDQVTKAMITARLPFGSYGPGSRIEVIPGFFNLTHVGNTGAAWSMFSGRSTGLAILALGTLVAIFFWRRALGLRQPGMQPAFGLLCGGVVGNLADRLRLGHVVDFLDFHFGAYVYPTFNVADSAILVGVCWYVLWSLRHPVPPAGAERR